MTGTINKRVGAVLGVAAAAVALALPGTAGAQEYVPFVTDFPRAEEEYVPFRTDFGIPPRPQGEPVVINPRVTAEPVSFSGRSWADLALGTALGFGLALLVVASGLGLRRLRAPSERAEAGAH